MSRRGMSLIEVVVVLAILALLMALLLPAIASTREAARRMQCGNNLRQLGLASANYESSHRVLPPGVIRGYSWLVMLLPHVDRDDLYRRFDFSKTQYDFFGPGKLDPLQQVDVSVFLCPSDPKSPASAIKDGVGSSNYVGCLGSGVLNGGFNGLIRHSYPSCLAPHYPFGLVRVSDVTNGMSNTVLASERLSGDGSGHLWRTNWELTENRADEKLLEAFKHACLTETPRQMVGGGWYGDTWAVRHWTRGETGATLYNHIFTPNQPSCHNGSKPEFGAFTASSLHPGGVNVVFGDGHGMFVSQSIESLVWAKMGSRVDRDISSCPDP